MRKVIGVILIIIVLGTISSSWKKKKDVENNTIQTPKTENTKESATKNPGNEPSVSPTPTTPTPSPSPKKTSADNLFYLEKHTGGRLDYSDVNGLVVFDKVNADGYARIWTMDISGNNKKCLTCDSSFLPTKHQGNPAWSSDGKFVALQVATPELEGPFSGTAFHKLITSPGSGVQNDIWIIDASGKNGWKMTSVGKDGAVLHPQFSHDGKKFMWAEGVVGGIGIGDWVIKMADFRVDGGVPKISNIKSLNPGGLKWYETHGFSSDNKTIIFSGLTKTGTTFDIYTYNLETNKLNLLTDPSINQWDEHAHFLPGDQQIIWMSSNDLGVTIKSWDVFVPTEYWIMNADGTNKKRLTFFNETSEKRVISADLTVSKDGKYLFAYIQDPGTMTEPGSVIRMNLK